MHRVTEEVLSRVWQSGMLGNRELVTASGGWLQVVRPGRMTNVLLSFSFALSHSQR